MGAAAAGPDHVAAALQRCAVAQQAPGRIPVVAAGQGALGAAHFAVQGVAFHVGDDLMDLTLARRVVRVWLLS